MSQLDHLAAFLQDFPDDKACTLLATLRDLGVRIFAACVEGAFAYWCRLNGKRFVGIGFNDLDAARALLLACGYDPQA